MSKSINPQQPTIKIETRQDSDGVVVIAKAKGVLTQVSIYAQKSQYEFVQGETVLQSPDACTEHTEKRFRETLDKELSR